MNTATQCLNPLAHANQNDQRPTSPPGQVIFDMAVGMAKAQRMSMTAEAAFRGELALNRVMEASARLGEKL